MNGIEYIADRDVDVALDAELRALLSICFTGPHNARFATQRFFSEMPAHRWLVRKPGRVIAHLALHDKTIGTVAGNLRVGGVAEVAVHPDCRGRGHARQLLAAADTWMRAQAIPFGFLFGRPEVYGSSGYLPVSNRIRFFQPEKNEWTTKTFNHALAKPLSDAPWPSGEIDLRGPMF